MKTNLGKTREEIIFEILLSLNKGNSECVDYRVSNAIRQYNQLVKNGFVVELPNDETND